MSLYVPRRPTSFVLVLLISSALRFAGAQQPGTEAGALLAATPAAPLLTPARGPNAPAPSIYGSMMQDDGNSTGPLAFDAGSYAVFHTSHGDYVVKLFSREAPVTVANFVELAQGRKPWKHPVTLIQSTRPIYNNTTIYRIIPNSMILGGDPINKGQGDSGTLLPLEISPDLKFDQPGLLAMDGNGTQSSGSRWFIVLRPFPDRTGNYTIFGKVVGGMDVVRAISNKPTRRPQSPLDPTLLNSIEIIEVPQGKRTQGSFSVEEGKKVLSIEKHFEDAPPPPPPARRPVATTSSAEPTTDTLSQGSPE